MTRKGGESNPNAQVPVKPKQDINTDPVKVLNDELVKILSEQVRLNETAKENAEAALKHSWLWPKIVLGWLGGVGTLAIAHQFYVSSDVSSRSKELYSLVEKAREDLSLYDSKFQSEIAAFTEKNEKVLSNSAAQTSERLRESLRDVEIAQQCLTLVAMGSEQASLKHNPMRALLFVESALAIYQSHSKLPGSNTASPPISDARSPVLAAVYPAIWNLQMECLLQTRQFDKLLKVSNDVLNGHSSDCLSEAKHCALRTAFYYRALARLPSLCSYADGLHIQLLDASHKAEFDKASAEFLSDLDDGIGGQSDQSLGSIYRALFLLSRGRYRDASKTLSETSELKTKQVFRPTSEQNVTAQLGQTINEMLNYIQVSDRSVSAVRCNLDPSVVTPWDGYLLEELVGLIAKSRQWHMTNGKPAEMTEEELQKFDQEVNRFGLVCVDFIMALRMACGEQSKSSPGCSDCAAGSADNTISQRNLEARTLYAKFGLKDQDGDVIYSMNRDLGRIVDGKRYMKLIVIVPVAEEMEIEGNRTVMRIRNTKEARFEAFDPNSPIPPAPYVKVLDKDLPEIYEKSKRDQEVPTPAAPTAASPAA